MVLLWFILLLVISFMFTFNAIFSPQGQIAKKEFFYIVASVFYVISWVAVSIYSGYKYLPDVLIAALVYSLLPFSLYINFGYIINTVLYTLAIIWTYPLQGIMSGTGSGNIALVALFQICIFIAGYMIGHFKRKPIK